MNAPAEIGLWYDLIRGVFLLYVVEISLFYLLGSLYAIRINILYRNRHILTDYKAINSSPLSPGISLIAPAYNESLTIIDNVRSLLSLEYPKMEVIVVNDGSKDDSIPKLVKYFELEQVARRATGHIKSKSIKALYRSKNLAYSNLLVIDKENGGKSDALNAGINYSKYGIIGCMDVDSILLRDSLQKLVKPFLDDEEVIATGGSVRIANSCEIAHGHLSKVKMPSGIIERFQVLEYLRAFLIGRMAWSGLNALLLISGAVGLFKKDLVKKVGGYRTDVVGEDIELVINMRRYMYDHQRKHKVVYVPDPVCWTEAPSDRKILSRQRNRWNRGAFEALWIHRSMIFNPKYGIIGMLSLPYWLFFEWMAPLIETIGVMLVVALVFLGFFDPVEFTAVTLMAYAFSVLISTMTIFIEEISFQKYTKKGEVFKLFLIAWLEPVFYHPLVVLWSLQGTWDKLRGANKGWGTMTRKGFNKTALS
jgi:biofilm PGA synthesis N-glycosyltransferase PgaC